MANYDVMTDILLYDTLDGGDIKVEGNRLVRAEGLETAIYLCLFGGNLQDDGSESTSKLQWWGNYGEPVENQYRSRFQALLNGKPFTSALINQLTEAAISDIMTMDVVKEVSVDISSPVYKRLDIIIKVTLKNEEKYKDIYFQISL